MIDSISDLRVFARIAATGTLSSAARDLGLSPSLVSKRLSRLEARMGLRLVHLFERWKDKVSHEKHLGQAYFKKLDGILPATLSRAPERYLLRDVVA